VIFLARRPVNPNAAKALEQLKLEIANDLGIENNLHDKNHPINNIFTAGPVGGVMTRKLVEMGERNLIDKENK
jgi:hypothetical protein